MWSGGAIGKVTIGLSTYPAGESRLVRCTVPSSVGTVTMTTADLAVLTAGNGYLTVLASSYAMETQGAWGLSLEAFDAVHDPNGRNVSQVTAQVQ